MSENNKNNAILRLENIRKEYSGVAVLQEVNIELNRGEVLCLVGENGAGKSTMIKIISGAITPSEGKLYFEGHQYNHFSPEESMKLGIATIYQDIDLVDNLTVADNIFLGKELTNKLNMINSNLQEKRANELFDEFHLHSIRGNMLLANLSTAQKQCVQIIKAIKDKAKILILDEPTVSLGEEETKSLMLLVKKMAKDGLGIIYISHFLDEIFEIGTDIVVLKDGVQVNKFLVQDTTIEEVINSMIGRDADSFYKRERIEFGNGVLEVKDYSNDETVKNVSFTMRSGEVFGLGGLVGSGRTELVRMIYGCDKKKSGELIVRGNVLTSKNPKDSIKKGIFMISEDRKRDGILDIRSIRENIMITKNEWKEFINLKKEIDDVNASIDMFGVKLNSKEDLITSLSGGNQQKNHNC